MVKNKTIVVIAIFTAIIVFSILVNKVENNLSHLNNWLGEYYFSECSGGDDTGHPFMYWTYEIVIYEKDSKLWSDISIDGQLTSIRYRAEVMGNNEEISLVLKEFLPGNEVFKAAEVGDILFTLKKTDQQIYTFWGKIQANLHINQEPGTYFELITD